MFCSRKGSSASSPDAETAMGVPQARGVSPCWPAGVAQAGQALRFGVVRKVAQGHMASAWGVGPALLCAVARTLPRKAFHATVLGSFGFSLLTLCTKVCVTTVSSGDLRFF